jgi:hypothetical protein
MHILLSGTLMLEVIVMIVIMMMTRTPRRKHLQVSPSTKKPSIFDTTFSSCFIAKGPKVQFDERH